MADLRNGPIVHVAFHRMAPVDVNAAPLIVKLANRLVGPALSDVTPRNSDRSGTPWYSKGPGHKSMKTCFVVEVDPSVARQLRLQRVQPQTRPICEPGEAPPHGRHVSICPTFRRLSKKARDRPDRTTVPV